MDNKPANSNIDLSKLEDTYEILSRLHDDASSSTYLARHRELGRDVTITVVHVPDGGEHNTLTHFASDARLLSTARHEHIIPVLEGRWLGEDTFAVVRVLARATSLRETITQEGPMPLPRVSETLAQVHEALEWARQTGVVHRNVTADTIGFQQGSGRVMMSLSLAPLHMDALPDACSDGRTIGALAWSMMTGRPFESATTDDRTLADLRPGLSADVIEETETLLTCKDGGEPRDVRAYIELLATAPERVVTAPVSATIAESTTATPIAARSVAAPTIPVGVPERTDQAVVVRSRFRSPVAAALVVAVLIVVAAVALLKWRSSDRTQLAGGDIDQSAVATEGRTSPMEAPPPSLPPGSAQPPKPVIDSMAIMMTPVPMPAYPSSTPAGSNPALTTRPSTTTPAPTTAAPVVTPTMPTGVTPATPVTVPKPDSVNPDTPVRDTTPRSSTNPCASTDPGNQRVCFNAALARQDVELNRMYGDVIAAMRRRANVADTDPDPENVRELRSMQRTWIAERDAECRRRGEGREGPRWAESRAQCFAELSAQRTRELAQIRDNIP
jgi:uncharacterized protein YecT (DUF1311 family)